MGAAGTRTTRLGIAGLRLPDRAVADAGGRKDVAVMKIACQHADASAVLRTVCAIRENGTIEH